jgi:preprotein translocase subunit SecA
MVTRRVEAAQKKVEERNFDVRKNLLEYDEVMDEQRKRVYGFRQKILDGSDCRALILEMVDRQVDQYVGTFLDKDYGPQSYATWASGQLACELDAADFRGLTPEEAERLATDQAIRQSETQIFEAVEENIPAGEDESEWNWGALASFANARWKTQITDRDLKKIGRQDVVDFLQERVREAIAKLDLSEGARFLDHDFGLRSACGWTQWRFGESLEQADVERVVQAGLDPKQFRDLVKKHAHEVYARRETEYPVLAGLSHFIRQQADGTLALDRGGLLAWARERFDSDLEPADLETNDLDQLRRVLTDALRRRQGRGDDPRDEMKRMERAVLLQILDNAWKDHLLAMDHLRSSVGLRGYAQVDPKVEYKREGMRTFDLMWKGIDERVTENVYKIKEVEDDALRSTWKETAAIHAAPPTATIPEPTADSPAPDRPAEEPSVEPIRNFGQKVGRNDPCPCGSGKKFKNCCGR